MCELRPIEVNDVEAVQDVIESDAAYVERVTGLPPGPADAQSLLMMRPPDLPAEHKHVFGLWERDELVGLVDVLRGHPDGRTAYIGLLQVRGDRQRAGLGTRAHDSLLREVAEWPEIATLRLAVVATNREVAEPFWRGLGYRAVGEPVPYRYDKLETTAQHLERPVHPDRAETFLENHL